MSWPRAESVHIHLAPIAARIRIGQNLIDTDRDHQQPSICSIAAYQVAEAAIKEIFIITMLALVMAHVGATTVRALGQKVRA